MVKRMLVSSEETNWWILSCHIAWLWVLGLYMSRILRCFHCVPNASSDTCHSMHFSILEQTHKRVWRSYTQPFCKSYFKDKNIGLPSLIISHMCIGKEHAMHLEIHTITSQLVYTQLIEKEICMGGHTLLGIVFMCNQYRSCYVYSNYDSIVTKYVDPTISHKHIWFNSYNTNVRSVILSVWHEWCFTNLIAIW